MWCPAGEEARRSFGKDERGKEMTKNKVVFFEIPASNFKKANVCAIIIRHRSTASPGIQ
jgi:hypothetical protein